MVVAIIVGAGVLAFWLAERFQLPEVLVAMGFGHLLGLDLHGTHAAEALRHIMIQGVGLGVAVLFFEGGRALAEKPLGVQAGLVRHLSALGPKLGWLLGSGLAWLTLGTGSEISLLIGAVLMVSAPYMAEPLVGRLQGTERCTLVLQWETFIVTCVGTAWSVLVAGALLAHTGHPSLIATLQATFLTALAGAAAGATGAFVLRRLVKHGWLGQRLEDAAALALLMLAFASAQLAFWGAGLVAAIVMGYGSSLERAPNTHKDFWVSARVLSLAILAISLGILIDPRILGHAGWRGLLLAMLMVGVVRPLLVLLGSRGSDLTRPERFVLMLGAPRGVLTLATASLLQLKLQQRGIDTHPVVGTAYWMVLVSILFPWFAGRWLVQREAPRALRA